MNGLRSSLIVLCVALCLFMPMGAGSVVLCLGADGHIGFESARNTRCTTPLAPTSTTLLQITPWTAPSDHCGPCVDAPLVTSDADSQRFVSAFRLVLQLEVPGFALVPWTISASPALPFTPFWPSPPRVTHTTLTALRTVILLI